MGTPNLHGQHPFVTGGGILLKLLASQTGQSEHLQDSFYKFFLDGWVRGVVTASDVPEQKRRGAGRGFEWSTPIGFRCSISHNRPGGDIDLLVDGLVVYRRFMNILGATHRSKCSK